MITDIAKAPSLQGSVSPPAATKRSESMVPESLGQQAKDLREQDEPSLDEIRGAAEKVAGFVGSIRSELSFTVDQASGINVIKVIDSNTKELIRQIPSREIIQLAQALDKLQGLFLKDKA